jgi:hypothetical protein
MYVCDGVRRGAATPRHRAYIRARTRTRGRTMAWQMIGIGSTYFEGAETPDGDNILVPMVKAIEELTRTCLVTTFILVYLY